MIWLTKYSNSQDSKILCNSKVYEIFADMILAADAPANGKFATILWDAI